MVDSQTPAKNSQSGIIERLWRFFSSIKLAFILMVVIALLSLIGALISQYTGEQNLYRTWVQNTAQLQYGFWTSILSFLQFFRIFHSVWFLGVGTLLVINILVCSLDRWKRISHVIRGGQILQAEGYYQVEGCGAVLSRKTDSSESAINSLIDFFKVRGYRVRKETSGEKVYIAADKNRYFRLGTYLTHFSLILFVIGFLVSGALGYRDNQFTVAVGGVENVGDNSGLSLKLLSFTDEYYPDGAPKDFRSEVVVYEFGKQVQQGSIRVNHPLGYKGYRFYQSSFGSSVLVQVKDENGQTLFNGSIQLNEPVQIETVQLISGFIDLSQAGLEITVFKASPGRGGAMIAEGDLVIQIVDLATQKVVNMGKVTQGTPTTLNNLEISYLGDVKFSGFQVARDPGQNFIWAASILMLAGLVMVFYFPLRQLWAVAIPVGPGSSRVLLRTTVSRAFNATIDLDNLVKQIESSQVRNKKNKQGER